MKNFNILTFLESRTNRNLIVIAVSFFALAIGRYTDIDQAYAALAPTIEMLLTTVIPIAISGAFYGRVYATSARTPKQQIATSSNVSLKTKDDIGKIDSLPLEQAHLVKYNTLPLLPTKYIINYNFLE